MSTRANTIKGVSLSKEEGTNKKPHQVEGMIAATSTPTTSEAVAVEHDPKDIVPVSVTVLKAIMEKIDMLTAGLRALQALQALPKPTQVSSQISPDVSDDHPRTIPRPDEPTTSTNTTTPTIILPGKISTKYVETSVGQLESWLTINNITDDEERFAILKLSMEPETYRQVAAIIQNSPATNKFQALKSHIIKTFTQSEAARIKSLLNTIELGNRRPSQLLAEMSALYNGPKDRIFVELFVSRLPSTVRCILMGMQSPNAGGETPVDTLAQWTDAITDQLDKGEKMSAIQNPNEPHKINELVTGLTESINAFNINARSRAWDNNKLKGSRQPPQ